MMESFTRELLIPELSIVTCIYKSEKYLEEFISECKIAVKNCAINTVEYIFVLDGITDNSLALLREKQNTIPNIKIIELSRNYGHHHAASAGLKESAGDLIFLIDCDLEISPRVLEQFYKDFRSSNADVVYGIQKDRKGGIIEKYLGGLFWIIFNKLSEIKVPRNIVTERLMNRNYVNALNSLGDKNLFMAGMMHWIGFKQIGLIIEKKQREGKSTYNFVKRFSLLVQAITSFSEKPLVFIFQFGVIITIISLVISSYFIIIKIMQPDTITLGYSSIIASIFLSLGILVSAIGIVGLYLSRVFKQVQNRPNYIIRKKH